MQDMATYRQRAWDVAMDRHGYVTTADAHEAGIPVIELAKMAHRGRLHHVAHGIYRFDEFPVSRFDQYFEAMLRVGDDAYLHGDAVLALHDLAQVNPQRIRVATRKRRLRRDLPAWITVGNAQVPEQDLTSFEGIRTTSVAQALFDARTYVMTDRLLDAIPAAIYEGLLDEHEARTLEHDLRRLNGS